MSMDLNTTFDKIKSTDSLTAMCSNCKRNEPIIYSSIESQKDDTLGIGEIKIWEIISYVYRVGNVSWDDFKNLVVKNNKSYPDNFLIDDLREESFGVCDLCLSLLSDTYKTFKKFEKLTHEISLIQQLQNACKKTRENCREGETSTTPSPNFLTTSPAPKIENEDLFDSFNFVDDHQNDAGDDFFTEEYKEAVDDSLEAESISEPQKEAVLKSDQISQQSSAKMSLNFSKQLVLKIEKLSTEDLEYYNAKKKTKMDPAVMEVVEPKRRNFKPVQKLKLSIAINEQKKKQSLTPNDNLCGKTSRKSFADCAKFLKYNKKPHFRDMNCKLSKDLTAASSIDNHMKIIHKPAYEKEKYLKTCELCGKTVFADRFKNHMRIHGPRKILKCDKCDKQYLDKQSYKDHILTHSDNYTPYLCRHCGSTFNDKPTLYTHERNHTAEKKLSCEICSKKFSIKSALEMHMVIHSKERPYVCDKCGMSYNHKPNLRRHMKVHKDIAEKGEYSSKCQICERIFKHSISLRKHMKIHEKKYKCSFCGKILGKICVLKDHEDLHKKNPNYQPRNYINWQSDLLHKLDPKPDTESH